MRELVRVEVREEQIVIKGLPVLMSNTKEYPLVGYFYIEATPVDFVVNVGDKFQIANQLRTWTLARIKSNKYGKKVAYFEKYNDRGNCIDSFYMIDGVDYLFAMTSGAARNGVVHKYRAPKNELEKLFAENGWGLSQIETVDNIDAYTYDGGCWCNHMVHDEDKYWCKYATDGLRNYELSSDGQFVEKHSNQYHIGCMESPAVHKIEGGTYLIELEEKVRQNFCHVFKTQNADETEIVEAIKSLLK